MNIKKHFKGLTSILGLRAHVLVCSCDRAGKPLCREYMSTRCILSALLWLSLLCAFARQTFAQGGIPLWTNRYNGPANFGDSAQAVAVDSSGNVFVTGYSPDANGPGDYTTVAYSGTGVPLWTNRYNGPGNDDDHAYAVAVDSSGNVFVTGESYGGNITYYDYATIKYSSAGVALWTNRYNGPANDFDFAYAVAVDSSGNVFVTGESWSHSSADYATIKYSSAGVPLWTNRYNGPGNGNDSAAAMAVDSSGNVFVTGSSYSGTNTYDDYATIKYSSAGVPLWTNRYNGPENTNDEAAAVAVDSSGNVFVTGYSTGTNTARDYATIKYSSAGVALWTNRYNGPANTNDQAAAVAVDSSGNVFVTGWSYGGTNADKDYATIAYSSAGVTLWTNRYDGGDTIDSALAMAVDKSGTVFVTGSSGDDYVTIKYSSSLPPPRLSIARDGSGGLFVRHTGVPDVKYRLQRAVSLVGPWSDVSTNTAPVSGLVEFHESNPPTGAAFYRTVQP
jgi:uncharacterized delta-60 repeat protein